MKEPKIRLKEFCGKWIKNPLSKIATMHARIGWQNLRREEYLSNGEFYLITGTDFIDGNINYKKCHYVEEERYNQDKNIQLNNGSILITKDGTLGKVAYVENLDKPATLNAGVFNVVCKNNDIDSRFLFQYLKSPLLMEYVNSTATGGTIKHLNQNILVNFPVYFPELKEQIFLGSYFKYLDSLIQSTTKKIESLKQVKAASLQSMFPQEEETKPRVRFKGFEGDWEKVAIKDIATINPKTNIPNIFEYVDLESVVGTELKSHRTETKQTAPSRAQRLASNGDIFYQTVRPYQKNNFYFDLNEDNFVFSSGYAQIRANLCGSFLFALMQQNSFVLKVMDNCTGTSFPAINANVLGTLEIMVTKNIVEQTAIASYFTNLDKQITLQAQCLEKLKQIKSACLDNMFV